MALRTSKIKPFLTKVKRKVKKAKAKYSGKYRAQRCTDADGNKYASLLERDVTLEFLEYKEKGLLWKFKTQVPYTFKTIGLNRKYIADMVFECRISFTVDTLKGPITFIKGQTYVVDIKSPATIKDPVYLLKRDLMRCVLGIEIIEILRSNGRYYSNERRNVK